VVILEPCFEPSLGSPLAAWHHKILAVIGYCTVWEIEWHWVASWPGIEELREELKDQ
jgi:hypothetical protein